MRSLDDILSPIYCTGDFPTETEIARKIGDYPTFAGEGSFIEELTRFYIQQSWNVGYIDAVKQMKWILGEELRKLDTNKAYNLCRMFDIEPDSLLRFISEHEEYRNR
jgi:hypothetical protein